MYRLARIYGFQAAPDEAAVFLDRLYPRGIRKETMSKFVWLKDLTPSAALREWYHQDPDSRFAEFARRYRAELAAPERQAALEELRRIHAEHPATVLLSAVKNPEHSHLSVLRDYLLSLEGSLKNGSGA
jgi:transcriptional regulator, MarR family